MFKNKVSILAGILLLSSSAMAGVWTVEGKISGTPHDLGGSTALDNGELCVYCHTPHAGNTSFLGAPLWNKGNASATSYKLYGANGAADTQGSTIAGTSVGSAAGELSSPSLACLSCHDGVSAINSILNAPGSGMGTLATGTTSMTAYNTANSNNWGGNIGGAGGANTVADMSNDHPVSIVYTEGAGSLRPTTTTLNGWVGVNDGAGSTPAAPVGTIAELLRGPLNMVECSSCHDPHNGYATNAEQGTAGSPQVNYLRHTNVASALCLGCHDK